MLIDIRCPKCDYPVYGDGRENVIIRERISKKSCECQKCGTAVTVTRNKTSYFPVHIQSFYYVEKGK